MASVGSADKPFLLLRRDLGDQIAPPVWPRTYHLRTFTQADAAAVHRVLQEAYAGGGGHVDAFDVWWNTLRTDSEFDVSLCFFAADENNRVCGVAQCWTSGFVKDLAVHPSVRRRGIAEALMLTVFSEFKRQGAAHVDLKIQADNAGALRLYRRLGMWEVT
jgi:ribosomal protein S18 acetylase RimI-like enzyme